MSESNDPLEPNPIDGLDPSKDLEGSKEDVEDTLERIPIDGLDPLKDLEGDDGYEPIPIDGLNPLTDLEDGGGYEPIPIDGLDPLKDLEGDDLSDSLERIPIDGLDPAKDLEDSLPGPFGDAGIVDDAAKAIGDLGVGKVLGDVPGLGAAAKLSGDAGKVVGKAAKLADKGISADLSKLDINPLGKDNPVSKFMPKMKGKVKLDLQDGLTIDAGISSALGFEADFDLSISSDEGFRVGRRQLVHTDSKTMPRFYFESVNLPPEVFLVTEFRGVEELSTPYRFEIDLISNDPKIDFADVVNQPATFIMLRDGKPIPMQGVVVDFEQLGMNAQYAAYRAVLAPRLWWLTLNFQSRIFQHLTVEEIITQVLTESGGFQKGLDFEFNLRGTYEPREYCVQYQETDFDFISRLMEHEGMFYYFLHDDVREKLVIADHTFEQYGIDEEGTVQYHVADGFILEDPERVHHFVYKQQVITGQAVLKDYNYETPDDSLRVEYPKKPEHPGTRYEYGTHYKDTKSGERLAQIRNEESVGRHLSITGGSNCRAFRSGLVFALTDHYREDYNEAYLLLSIQHEGSQWQTMELDVMVPESAKEEVLYHNTFQCQPAGMPFRPARTTPVPQVPGVMVARIEHPKDDADDYSHLDDQGRYRAKMNFDMAETESAQATLPIRMNQPYSGPGYGMHFPQHEGTEMIFACINGDIDRPIALGTAPNPNQSSPSIVENKWQNVIRTWGKNELTFDDKKDEENIYMHATKDHTVQVNNNENITVNANQTINVGHNRSKTVGNDEYIDIVGDRVTEIHEGHELFTVEKGSRLVAVHGEGGDVHYVTKGNREAYVAQDNYTFVEKGSHRVYVKEGDASYVVKTGNHSVTVAANSDHTAEGTLKSHSEGEMTVSSAKKITITAKDEIVLVVGSSSITISKDKGIILSSPKVSSNAVGTHEITGALVKIN